jgi:hypothetical protein
MGLEDIFGKELRKYYEELDNKYVSLGYTFRKELREDYENLANSHGLDYWEGDDYFFVSANKRLSEDADHRKKYTPPWPGIKIHSPLSAEMYNVLRSYDFIQMLKNGEIDGFKVYIYGDDDPFLKPKEVTIYISVDSMPNLRKLLNILEKNGIFIQPALSSYYHQGYKMVFLNKMVIAPYAGIFARYSTDFTDKMNVDAIKNIRDSMMANIDTKDINNYLEQVRRIDEDITAKYRSKIDDKVWRAAADISSPQIVVVPRSWLLNNQYNLDEILRNSYASLKDFHYKLWKNADPKELLRYSPTIYTFITLKEIEGTIVPNPNIIISYDKNNNLLEAYDVLNAKIVKYDLSNEEDLIKVSDHPQERLYKFLKNGTAYP